MNRTFLPLALLLLASPAPAEVMNCNVSGTTLFTLIDFDTVAKTAVMTDNFGKETPGKITLIRDMSSGKKKLNISAEYEINNTQIDIDLIIVPVRDEEYSVGMAGYSEKDGKRLLEIAGKDKAMCF
jgi:hypothetical protein